jgi:hypothetical protein
MVDYQSLSIVLTGIGIIIALTYYALQIRNQNKTRQSQIFMQIHSRWYDKEFWGQWREISSAEWEDYDDYNEKFSFYANPDFGDKLLAISTFFAGMGVMVHRGMIDPGIVDDLVSGVLIRFWEKYRPIYLEIRVRRNWPQYGEWIEYLYNRIKPIAEQQHPELKT